MSKTPTIEGEVASAPLPADDAATQAPQRVRLRVAGDLAVTGVRRAVLSPLTYLLGAATTIYLAFAYNQYKQLQVGACDLGIFYQAVHGWAYNANPYVPIKGFNHLGDHFAPIFLLLSPALWVHNSPFTLVVAQVVLLVSSAIPVYLAVKRMFGMVAATLVTAAYLLSIGMQGSVAFPVHEVMFSAPLVAWGIERALAKRWTQAALFIGATVFSKEDMGVMVVMFAFWALLNRKWRHSAVLAVWGVLWFVLAVKVIIPHFNPAGFTYSGDYKHSLHSDNLNEAIIYMVTHPFDALHTIFGNAPKRETWQHLLGPVGGLCVFSPIALLGLPMMVSRMVSDRDTLWSWQLYYDMPLMPIVYIGAMDGVRRLLRVARWALAAGRDRFRPAEARTGETPADDANLDVVDLEPDPVTDGGTDGAGTDVTAGDGGTGAADPPRRDERRPGPSPVWDRVAAGLIGAVMFGVMLDLSQHMQLNNWWSHGWFRSPPALVANSRAALDVIPSGVEVRATNNLTIPIMNRDTVTLIGSHQEKGNWAAIDTTMPGCPIGPDAIPSLLNSLRGQGFRVVAQRGSIVVMHRGG